MTDGFICVSDQTKNDLLEFYPNEARHKPIYVAQHGNPRSSFLVKKDLPPDPRAGGARGKVFLFVGNRAGYKAFDVATDAFRVSRLWEDGYTVLCTGSAFTPAESRMLRSMRISAFFRSAGSLSMNDLFALYATSVGLLYPSRYEGFGLPIIEAMAFGCVPLVADLDPMRTIAGGISPPFPAGDSHALSERMVQIADPKRRAALSNRAVARAQNFRWGDSVRQHIDLYRRLGAG